MKTHIARPNNTKTLCGKSNRISDGLKAVGIQSIQNDFQRSDCATCNLVYSRYWGLSK